MLRKPLGSGADGISEWFRAQRKAAGLTQKAVAAAIGIHQGQISEIERGLSYPFTRAQIEEFARITGASIVDGLRLAGYRSTVDPPVPDSDPDFLECVRLWQLAPPSIRAAVKVVLRAGIDGEGTTRSDIPALVT